jgi:hypothetical protein
MTDSTPFNAFIFASVLAGHFSHFQPLTLMVSVFIAASAAVLEQSAIANPNRAVFMASSLRGTFRKGAWRPLDNSVNLAPTFARFQGSVRAR